MAALSLFAFRRRRRDDRVLTGVAGGFAATHGVDPFVLRAALVVLALAGGLGVAIYLLALLVAGPPPCDDDRRLPAAIDPQRNLAVGCLAAGLLLFARGIGLWPGDALMVPVLGIGAGLAVVGARSGASGDPRLDAAADPRFASIGDVRRGPWGPIPAARLAGLATGRRGKARIVAGTLLIVFGLAAFGGAIGGPWDHNGTGGLAADLRSGAFGAVLALAGVALAFGPFLARVGQQLGDERRQRIRSEERAAVATHLHDSVLQTLALIQRNAQDPRRTVTLARRQERELRDWLYGPAGEAGAVELTLGRAVNAMAEEVEDLHDVKVELVTVGDRPADEQTDALVAAAREALVNAAKHAQVDHVSVYVEVAADGLHAYVRDRGVGFDPSAVPQDRRGLAQSIRGRIRRAGGTVEIDSEPGGGTEVRLFVPTMSEAQP